MASTLTYITILFVFGFVSCLPQGKTNVEHNNHQPQPHAISYMPRNFDAMSAVTSNIARFLPGALTSLQTFLGGLFVPGTGALSGILSLNPGNLIIVALVAGAAILLWPLFLGALGLGASTIAGRSGDGATNARDELTATVYNAIDRFFRQYNIDAAVCMQRFACTASSNAAEAVREGRNTSALGIMDAILSSEFLSNTLGKTRFMDAVKFGKRSGNCDIEYGKCPFSLDKFSQYFNNGYKSPSVQAVKDKHA